MRKVWYILFVLTLIFITSEVAIRLLYPQHTTIKWIPDSTVGKRLSPNQKGAFASPTGEYVTQIEVNSAGFRDSEHALQKSEGVYRILILGDSFVENFQVNLENTFFKQLERNLKIPDKKLEIIALGQGDTGTTEQYLNLKEIGIKYNPDLVVHIFFTGNDVKNNSLVLNKDPHRPYFEIQDESLKPMPFIPRSENKIKDYLKSNFRIVEFLLDTKGKLVQRANKSTDYPIDYHVYDKNYNRDYKNAWEVTKKLILETKAISPKYLLVATANNEQVNNKVYDGISKIYPNFNNENIDLEKPDSVLKEFCEKEKIDCLFMLPYFRDFVSKNPNISTHYKFDGHWNEAGTNLTAQFLIENLANYFSIK